LRSPAKDALEPVNEKNGKGTGIGTLMPTCIIANYVKHACISQGAYFNKIWTLNYPGSNFQSSSYVVWAIKSCHRKNDQ
jgi:hypothetical protein